MLATLYAKLAALGLVLAALTGLFLWGHHEGAAGVQARWDAAKAAQQAVAAEAALQARAKEDNQRSAFNALTTKYEEATHAPLPSVADAVGPAVAAGTLRLRDEPAAVCRGQVSVAASRSRAADAAATQALADRVANSIAAVRAGDEADRRERALGQQIIALQAVLQAERQPSPTPQIN